MTGKLIGICGYKGAGKTTVTATAIFDPRRSMRALPVYQMGFMKPVTLMLEAMGIPDEIISNKKRWNEPLEMLCGHSTRFAAETLGTEWGRDIIGANVWVRVAINQARAVMKQGISVAIDGVRYPNEFEQMRLEGAAMIALHRPGLEVETHHESERHIAALQKDCEHRLDNYPGTFEATARRMRELLTGIIE